MNCNLAASRLIHGQLIRLLRGAGLLFERDKAVRSINQRDMR